VVCCTTEEAEAWSRLAALERTAEPAGVATNKSIPQAAPNSEILKSRRILSFSLVYGPFMGSIIRKFSNVKPIVIERAWESRLIAQRHCRSGRPCSTPPSSEAQEEMQTDSSAYAEGKNDKEVCDHRSCNIYAIL